MVRTTNKLLFVQPDKRDDGLRFDFGVYFWDGLNHGYKQAEHITAYIFIYIYMILGLTWWDEQSIQSSHNLEYHDHM